MLLLPINRIQELLIKVEIYLNKIWQFKNIHRPTLLVLVSFITMIAATIVSAESSTSMAFGYVQNEFQLSEDDNSQIAPNGYTIGVSHQLSEQWQFSVGYGVFRDNTSWPVTIIITDETLGEIGVERSNRAETESRLIGVGASWISNDYVVSFSYASAKGDDRSLTWQPFALSSIHENAESIEFNIETDNDYDLWFTTWGVGIQQLTNKSSTIDSIGSTQPVVIRGNSENKNLSVIAEFDVSYLIELSNTLLVPSLNLSWNWAIDDSTQEAFVATRGDEIRHFSNLNDRLFSNTQEPGSGYIEWSFSAEWSSDFSTTLSYGKTLASQLDVESISIDLNYNF